MGSAESPRGRNVAAVVAASALAGFAMGALRPALQVALEPAQVLAGLVRYPEGNPFGLYQASVWTAWHQALAPLLAAGVHERALSVAVSGLLGAIAFAAIGAFALAAGAAPWLACALPFLVSAADPATWGFHYGIYLLAQGHTYGTAGLAWLLLVLGLLGTGRWRAGAFALGFAPALHAALGAWLALGVGAAAALSWRELLPRWRPLLAGGALGAGLAAASLGLHLSQAPGERLDPAEATRYLDAFVRLWDAHRVAPALASWRGATVLAGIGIALALLTSPHDRPPAAARFALRALVVVAALALGLGALQHAVAPGALPDAVEIAMPTRLLNLPMLAFLPLAAGTLWRRRSDPLAHAALLALAVGALAAAREPRVASVGLPLLGLATLAAVLRARPAAAPAPRRSVDAAIALACAASLALGLASGVRELRPRLAYLIDRSNDRVLATAARGTGVLAVGSGIERAQLRTLRPLLLDPGALDMLPYALAGGPALARILERVYGIDFFQPPANALHKASLPEQPARALWEARAPSEWQALGREFGFSEVLVVARWRLRLPEVARDRQVALYRVPVESGFVDSESGCRRSSPRSRSSCSSATPSGPPRASPRSAARRASSRSPRRRCATASDRSSDCAGSGRTPSRATQRPAMSAMTALNAGCPWRGA
jgi:hypothetical protein